MSHTPGPWWLATDGTVAGKEEPCAIMHSGQALVGMFSHQRNADDVPEWPSIEDGRLMTAAPELLAALERTQWCCHGKCAVCGGWDPTADTGDHGHEADCLVAKAIAKAKGSK